MTTTSTSAILLPVLPKAQADLLLRGNSVYLDIGKDHETILYYAADGAVRVLHASGKRDSGQWTLQDDGSYSIDWLEGPKGSCSRVHAQAGDIRIFNLAGEPRGRVVQIRPGLAPEFYSPANHAPA